MVVWIGILALRPFIIVRAFHPWPGSFTLLPDGRRLQVHATVVEPGEGEPGCLIDEGLCVTTRAAYGS